MSSVPEPGRPREDMGGKTSSTKGKKRGKGGEGVASFASLKSTQDITCPEDLMAVDAVPAAAVADNNWRHVHSSPERNAARSYCSNVVTTSKYTLLTFLPLFLFEEFSRVANFYFLVVSILQTVKSISNTNGFPSCGPVLFFILSVDAVFAILEDRRRHRADALANSRLTDVYERATGLFTRKPWADIVVGDFVHLHNHEPVPADLLVLAVSESDPANPTGICYVETKSLDGETNLKLRQAMEVTVNAFYPKAAGAATHTAMGQGHQGHKEDDGTLASGRRSARKFAPTALEGGAIDQRGRANTGTLRDALDGIDLELVCEQPNVNVNKFDGTLHVGEGGDGDGEGLAEPVPFASMLLRGCTLRNTEWAFGMVINTGPETKVMMAMTKTPFKRSSIDKRINHQIARLVTILFACCAVSATLSTAFFQGTEFAHAWYLHTDAELAAASGAAAMWFVNFFYFFLLMYQVRFSFRLYSLRVTARRSPQQLLPSDAFVSRITDFALPMCCSSSSLYRYTSRCRRRSSHRRTSWRRT